MTPKKIQILNQACQMAGIDTSKISPVNPFEKSGGTATLLQGAVAEVDPEQAAKWRVAAGGSLSVATLSEMQTGQPLSQKALEDRWQHDSGFVVEYQKEQQVADKKREADMDQAVSESRLRLIMDRTGRDEAKARHLLKTEDEAHARHQAGSP
jgi:hypothetical protein